MTVVTAGMMVVTYSIGKGQRGIICEARSVGLGTIGGHDTNGMRLASS